MRNKQGFTLVELAVVLGIIGILAATAVPLYNTWQQRAYGSEAAIMMKQLLDGQVMYFLEHEEFFPGQGEGVKTYLVNYDGSGVPAEAVEKISDALKLSITSGHLQYQISNLGNNDCLIMIDAPFPIFRGGQTYLWAVIDQDSQIKYVGPDDLG